MAQPSRWLAGVLMAGVATAAACGDDAGSGGSGGEGGDTTTSSSTTSTKSSSSATTGSTTSSSASSTNTTATTSTGMGGEAEGGGGSGQGGEGGEGGGGQMVACVDVTDPALECDAPDAAACECWGCTLPTCADDMGNFNDCVCSTCAGDAFCSDPTNCNNDGICDPFNEGCVCADCFAHPACAGQVENCTNGIDDNGNGDVDCADAAFCASDPACDEDCDNGVDDNGDGDVDCADALCAGDPACATASCTAAVAIMLGTTMGDTTTGTSGLEGGCQLGGALEKVYTFTPAAAGLLQIVLNSTTADLGVHVRTTCADDTTEIGCVDAVASGDETLLVSVTSGTPISIIVDGWETGEAGPFSLTLAQDPNGCFNDGTCDAEAGEACTCTDCVSEPVCGFCDATPATCDLSDACTCDACDADSFCTDPTNCTDDGFCDQFNEGCQCADCTTVPNCL